MFGIEFYPTKREIIEEMLRGYDVENRVILEPSAGSGNIVKLVKDLGAAEVLACEIDDDLRKILSGTCKIIEPDFFEVTREQVSHIDLIIANPPFSNADKHILHMWEVAPDGCEIISLCNSNTVKNAYSGTRQQLGSLIEMHGATRDLGKCFQDALRFADVEVSLICLKKPGQSKSGEFDGFFMDDDEPEQQANALMPYNVVRDLVNRYVEALKLFDQQIELGVKMNAMTGPFFSSKLAFSVTKDRVEIVKNDYKKDLQKEAWNYVFQQMNMQKHTTKGLREKINQFVEQQQQIPFTMKNIYRMLEIVIGTTSQRMDQALVEVFDKLTQHYHENRLNVEGWKTNSSYLMNEKFIMPWLFEMGWSGQMSCAYRGHYEILNDFTKALCYITGRNYDEIGSLWDFCQIRNGQEKKMFGQIYQWGFFEFRGYKKGTGHFKFIDQDVWAMFNINIARIKGYNLPENVIKRRK